jgi:PAS domain S-box-containing protein
LLCLLDQDGYFLKVNKFLSQALGYVERDLIRKNFLNFIHSEDKESYLRQLTALSKNEVVCLFKNRYRCSSGLYKSFSWKATLLPDKTFYASARDITDTLRVQNQLAKALTDIQKIYDNSLDVLCSVNEKGEFTKVSRAAKAIWGYEEHEILGRESIEFVHPDDVERTIAISNKIKLGNSTTHFENRYIHKNGSVVPLMWSAQWLPAENCMFATARDATESVKQKQQLHFNERRLESLIRSGNDCISVLSIDAVYKYVSPSIQTLFHIDPTAIIGKSPFDYIHPDHHLKIKDILEYALTTEEPIQSPPFKFRNGKDEWCWVETIVTNKLNDPSIHGIVANSRDISVKIKDEEEKQLAAEKLRLSNERYELISEVTKDIIWDWNLQTNQLSWSSGLETHFGYSKAFRTVNIDFWKTYIHSEDRNYVLKSIDSIINNPNEKFWRKDYRFLKADGSVAYIIDQGYVIRDSNQKAVRMVGAMHDNTSLKEKELRILCQNKRLREIAQINSHVIRRPVASILGLLDLLDKNAVNGEGNLEIFEHLLAATEELDTVVRQINDRAFD